MGALLAGDLYATGDDDLSGDDLSGDKQKPVSSFVAHADGTPRLQQSPRSQTARLRCLCLHGYGSNNEITEMQVDNLKLEALGVACDFMEAAHACPPQNETLRAFSDRPFRSWVLRPTSGWDIASADGSQTEALRTSLVRSLRDVAAVAAAYGPYDMVYGFSLGASMATALCCPEVWGELLHCAAPPFRFIVSACAGGSALLRCPMPTLLAHDGEGKRAGEAKAGEGGCGGPGGGGGDGEAKGAVITAGKPLGVGSLHIIGQRDPGRADSERVADLYGSAGREVFRTAFGHEIPMQLRRDKALQEALASFLETVVAEESARVPPPPPRAPLRSSPGEPLSALGGMTGGAWDGATATGGAWDGVTFAVCASSSAES